MKKRMVVAATATAVVGLAASVTAASAADYIYWMRGLPTPTIARANLDGTGVNESFIPGLASFSSGVAVDASKIYWLSGSSPKELASANLDGSGVNNSLGSLGNSFNASQFALAGSFVYTPPGNGPGSSIARIGTDGLGLNTSFVATPTGGAALGPVATDGTYLYTAPSGGSAVIARANLSDGLGVTTNFITGVSGVKNIAATTSHVYWTTPTAIWRANADGSGKAAIVSGLTNADFGIAVTSEYIYWGSTSGGGANSPVKIGRAKLDGSNANPDFITGITGTPVAIAVTPGAGGGSTPAPTPTPTPTPAPTPAASTLATPTVNTSAPGQNAVVTVRVQLAQKGKYTFIFEKPTSNEMSREQATSSRVPMQKGTRIGTRRLKKTYTAAVITTTADNAKVVTRALLRKAQAKKLNLRVVYAPTGTAQSESVIKIK